MPKVKKLRLACCICENTDPDGYEVLYPLSRGEVIRCSRCDLIYVNDLPPLHDGQGDEYFAYWGIDVYQELEGSFSEEFRQALEEITMFNHSPGKLLDIGCGPGYFLTVARQYGWEAVGLDVSQDIVNLAGKRGERVFCCTVEEFAQKHPAENFDCITLFNILEHLVYPARALSVVRKILQDNGIVVIETPTEDSLIRRTAHLLYRLSGGKCDHLTRQLYHCGGHHFGFSQRTIRMLLASQGFEVISIQPVLSSPKVALRKRKAELAKAKGLSENLVQLLLMGSIALAWLGATIFGPRHVANRMRIVARPEGSTALKHG
ncbi:MAG: class I SAM-dependent methyltransferase [bacterium]